MSETWYTVELKSGGTAKGHGGRWNLDAAETLAGGAASETDQPILVVKHTREVVATYRRTVDITVSRQIGGGDD